MMSIQRISRRVYRKLRCFQNSGSVAGKPCQHIVEYRGAPWTVVDDDDYGKIALKPTEPRDWTGPALLAYIKEAGPFGDMGVTL